MKPNILLIVAAADQRIIGNTANEIPWPRIKRDMDHFKETTLGHPVIMGRVTFESLPKKDGVPKPLPGRQNIVITRNPDYVAPENVWLANSVEEAIQKARILHPVRICIIGGEQIYETSLHLADEIYYTDIELIVKGSTTFPAIPADFILMDSEKATEEVKFPDGTRTVKMEFQKWVRKID